MSGTKAGGKKAGETNRKLHGKDFYRTIGAIGGATKTNKLKGFAAHPELASKVGKIGGKNSKRTALTPERRAELASARAERFLILDEKVEMPIIELSKPWWYERLFRG